MKKEIVILIISIFLISFVSATNGCNLGDLECGSTPTDNCDVTQDTTFNMGTYNLPNGIDICSDNVILNCNGARIIGDTNPLTTGIKAIFFSKNIIKNCNIKNYDWGIFIWTDTDKTLVINNIIENTRFGIGSAFNTYNKIINNTIINSSNSGILVQDASHNHVAENLIRESLYGIRLEEAFPDDNYQTLYNAFFGNIIMNNTYGTSLFLFRSSDSFYILNNFINNNRDTYIRSDLTGWSLRNYGNYWDKFDEQNEGCFDENNDNVCDTPYILLHSPLTRDNFPLKSQFLFQSLKSTFDSDGDNVLNIMDNCPETSNPNQEDSNNNGIGDACEKNQIAADCNQDEILNVFDIVCYIKALYPGFDLLDRTRLNFPCNTEEANKIILDINGDNEINNKDIAYLGKYLFDNGPAPVQGLMCINAIDCPNNFACEIGEGASTSKTTIKEAIEQIEKNQEIEPYVKEQTLSLLNQYQQCALNGDVDQNKKVNINDYYALKYYLSGLYKINSCLCNADVNEDKKIDYSDASVLYYTSYYYDLPKESECETIQSSSPNPSLSPTPYY